MECEMASIFPSLQFSCELRDEALALRKFFQHPIENAL